jgi:hypothetical protein
MQSKGLKNSFSEETRELFTWNEECWVCSENGWDCIHHILGRVSDSPLNCAPIHNFRCHIGNGKLATFAMKSKLLKKTLKYLLQKGYVLTEKDKAFKKKYFRYYL